MAYCKVILEKLLAVGRFFRLVDEYDPWISIINLGVGVIFYKFLTAETCSIESLSSLLLALLAYQWKRWKQRQN